MATPSIQLGPADDVIRQLSGNRARPFEDAPAMPPAVYTSSDLLEREQRDIFRREWPCVGREHAGRARRLSDRRYRRTAYRGVVQRERYAARRLERLPTPHAGAANGARQWAAHPVSMPWLDLSARRRLERSADDGSVAGIL